MPSTSPSNTNHRVMTLNMPSTTTMAMSPGMGINSSSYLPNLEAQYCKDYSCCGQTLPTLHDLLRHYEESHIAPSPPVEQPHMARNTNNVMEVVSTNDVFMSMGGPGGPRTAGRPGHAASPHGPRPPSHAFSAAPTATTGPRTPGYADASRAAQPADDADGPTTAAHGHV